MFYDLSNLANTALSMMKKMKEEMSTAPVKSVNITWVVTGQDDQLTILPEINIQFDTVVNEPRKLLARYIDKR